MHVDGSARWQRISYNEFIGERTVAECGRFWCKDEVGPATWFHKAPVHVNMWVNGPQAYIDLEIDEHNNRTQFAAAA